MQAELATVAGLPHYSATSDHSLLYRSDGAGPTGPPCSASGVCSAVEQDAPRAPRTSSECACLESSTISGEVQSASVKLKLVVSSCNTCKSGEVLSP